MSFDLFLKKIGEGQDLSADETGEAFERIFSGAVMENDLAAFLTALAAKGETERELTGAVQSMRANCLSIKAPPGAMDIVGTGGDGHDTLNISTAVALVTAACGVPVAKHGNRAATSRSGSSDVLAALGVNLEPEFSRLEQCLAEANLCFLFAPRHHPGMRHVAAVRKKIGSRTIFNLLGPLTNPANVTRHLIGVYDRKWLTPFAHVLRDLGSEAAWVTRGRNGMDELTTVAANDVVALRQGEIRQTAIDARDEGLALPDAAELRGGDPGANAAALAELLSGRKSAYRDIVMFNVAAALIVAGKTDQLRQGIPLAAEAIDSGAARGVLDKVIAITDKASS